MLNKKTLLLTAALTAFSATAWAHTASTAKPVHQSMMSRIKSHIPVHGAAAPASAKTSHSMIGAKMGRIIGDKNTHVYHLPGDKMLPAEKNRVYFSTAAAARAAGYHLSGSHAAKMTAKKASKKMAMKASKKTTKHH